MTPRMRLIIHAPIGTGGMASVHLGRLRTALGLARTVAVKRPHRHVAKDSGFAAMLVDEARLMLRIQHPNVVTTIDVIVEAGDIHLVMDYVHGESLAGLLSAARAQGTRIPLDVAVAILAQAARGLHAAHEARSETGSPLGIVHRDVSPHNLLVGVDGLARVLDFGIAKAVGRLQTTREGQLKGKLRYMAPEALEGAAVDRRADIHALGVVAWEVLTGRRLHDAPNEGAVVRSILRDDAPSPRSLVPDVTPALDAVVARALARDPEARHATAADLASALEAALVPAAPERVGAWVSACAATVLAERAALVARVESGEEPVDDGAADGGSDTGVTVIDLTQPLVLPRRLPSRRRALVLAAVALGVLVVAGTTAAAVTRDDRAPAAGTLAAPTSSHDPSPADFPTEEAPRTAPLASGAPSPPVTANPRARRPAPPASRTHRCNPPYVTDERGVQRFKPECLR